MPLKNRSGAIEGKSAGPCRLSALFQGADVSGSGKAGCSKEGCAAITTANDRCARLGTSVRWANRWGITGVHLGGYGSPEVQVSAPGCEEGGAFQGFKVIIAVCGKAVETLQQLLNFLLLSLFMLGF